MEFGNDTDPFGLELYDNDEVIDQSDDTWERVQKTLKMSQREEVMYPPERGPPIFDFLAVFSAFVAAVFAAYYSISWKYGKTQQDILFHAYTPVAGNGCSILNFHYVFFVGIKLQSLIE